MLYVRSPRRHGEVSWYLLDPRSEREEQGGWEVDWKAVLPWLQIHRRLRALGGEGTSSALVLHALSYRQVSGLLIFMRENEKSIIPKVDKTIYLILPWSFSMARTRFMHSLVGATGLLINRPPDASLMIVERTGTLTLMMPCSCSRVHT